jgi:hypothetical protein
MGENAQTQALIAKSRADIESRWIMAMQRPRDLDEVRQLLRRECSRPGFAEVATYARPVGKKQNDQGQWVEAFAEGLSIRFAEVALRCMGNISTEAVTLFDGETERMIRITATDLESNATWSRDVTIKKTVERKQLKKGQASLGTRLNSYGDRVYIVEATDSEVAVKEAAEVSKASRTAILRIIPGHLQDECFELCRKVAADKSARDPEGSRNACLDAFAGVQVSKADLEELIGGAFGKASPAQIDDLRRLYVAIRDGESTWAETIAARREVKPAAKGTEGAPQAPGATQPATGDQPAGKPAAAATGKAARGTEGLKASLAFDAAKDMARAKDAARGAPVAAPPMIERPCSGCGVPIDVRADAAAGAQCDACERS